MKNWKNVGRMGRALCLGLAFSLSVSVTAAADEILPPTGPALEALNQSAQTGGSGQQTQAAQGTGGAVQIAEPQVQAQGAALYDATNGRFLYEKNGDAHLFPASITKLMTALLVAEHCSLDETVTFSQAAVTNLELGAVTLKVKAGDQFSVKDCLYGLLLKSANEVANGLAEHVAGSVSAFADRMNQKAASLGCTNTHFVNPNGLNNSNHYTSAHDMALIAKAAFENDTVRQVASTLTYDFPATASVPSARHLQMGHKMLNPANAEYYPGIVGGKTGYTSLAGNTLVTCAERDGVRLIAVVLKSSQTHYSDTKSLLDYGFEVIAAKKAAGSGPAGGTQSGPSGVTGTQSGPSGAAGNQSGPSGSGSAQNPDTASFQGTGTGQSTDPSVPLTEGSTDGPGGPGTDGFARAEETQTPGWHLVDGHWRHFADDGTMEVSRWIETGGYWYYVDANGALFTDGVTPDGYTVDANGVWIS